MGLPDCQLRKLQVAQNNAARLLTRTKKREHISPVLAALHWLPIKHRIEFKVLSMIHKSFHSLSAPDYLKKLCRPYVPSRNLRSGDDPFKVVQLRTRNSYGARTLGGLGARLWNALPMSLRKPRTFSTFKKNLKTHSFRISQ